MLTVKEIQAARPREKPYKLYDGHGLYLQVTPTGGRHWRCKYKVQGREKLLSFGPLELVPLAEAREKRDAARKLLLDGKDPGAERATAKADRTVTFKDVGEEWLGKQAFSPATLGKARWLFDTWLYPAIGSRPVKDVTTRELLGIVRSAETSGANETAHRIRSRASQVFRYAVAADNLGGCTRDPAADLRGALAPTVVTHHASVKEPRAVGALLRALDGYDGEPTVCYALKLAPHLFVRPGELRAAEWTEFDEKAKQWRIPAARTKLRREHLVPLSKQVVKLLTELRAHTGRRRFVFPAFGNSNRYLSENTLGAALRRLGYSGDQMTAHGFRSMASTLLHELGKDTAVIELCMAHKEPNKVKAAYNAAERLPERKKLMQEWSNYLDKLRAMKPEEK
ncbi:MAG: integrase arm-type DNA-binding domain-containing protein [Pseudomonadota bacterium]